MAAPGGDGGTFGAGDGAGGIGGIDGGPANSHEASATLAPEL